MERCKSQKTGRSAVECCLQGMMHHTGIVAICTRQVQDWAYPQTFITERATQSPVSWLNCWLLTESGGWADIVFSCAATKALTGLRWIVSNPSSHSVS